MRTLALLGILGATAAAAGSLFVYGGFYDISATGQHFAATYRLLDTAMRRSVKLRAARIDVPDLEDEARIARGLVRFRQDCVQCHGAPGVAPEPFALGMMPVPANLAYTAREWPATELYWVIRNGIKMTGMPAWQYRMGEDDLWDMVAFLKRLPLLAPDEYRALAAKAKGPGEVAPPSGARPDSNKAVFAMNQCACVTCHRIPGVVGASAPVGPPLERMGSRAFIAGVLPNTPENMVRWLRFPQSVSPRSAMPDLGVTEQDARDIAAYLARLK